MDLEMTNHTYSMGVAGELSSQVTFVCNLANWKSWHTYLMNSTDAISPNLVCKTIRATPLSVGGKEDWTCEKMQLVVDYVPRLSIEALTVDLPLKWRLEVAGQTVTVAGNLKWASDNAPFLKRGALPVKRFSLVKIVLYGMRSSFNLSDYRDLIDHVNSDTFLGAAAGTVLFESIQASQKMLLEGNIIYQVEFHLTYRPFGWNKVWRDYPFQVDELVNMDGSKIYPLAALSPLLNA